ncbi:MAG: hypothetical protein J2P54_19645, partial [Bradyrhizobiaceae bacterium]|nr:hypothetical protein [Bradyrhizobiaceae bacterium]
MTLSSMTGFARADGVAAAYAWAWELKSVNAKGIDLRLRLPPGWDVVEVPVRRRASEALARGTVYATLSIERTGVEPAVRVNDSVLAAVLATIKDLSGRVEAAPPRLDGILAIKGVIEVVDAPEREEDRRRAEAAVIAGFERALAELRQMRRHEGEVLARVLLARLAEMATLAAKADAAPGRQPEAIKRRIAEQIAALWDNASRFDTDRLHQEAILIASKADVREELDRLNAHVAQ